MLVKVSRVLLAVFVAIGCAQVSMPTALAEGICSPEAHSGSQYKTIGAQLSSCDKTQSAGTQSAGGSSDSSDGSVEGCFNRHGEPVDCWRGEQWWNSAYDAYCEQLPASETFPNNRVDSHGDPVGTFYRCFRPGPYGAPCCSKPPSTGSPTSPKPTPKDYSPRAFTT